jgi:hypothetical protein
VFLRNKDDYIYVLKSDIHSPTLILETITRNMSHSCILHTIMHFGFSEATLHNATLLLIFLRRKSFSLNIWMLISDRFNPYTVCCIMHHGILMTIHFFCMNRQKQSQMLFSVSLRYSVDFEITSANSLTTVLLVYAPQSVDYRSS